MSDWPAGAVAVDEAWTHIETVILGAPASPVTFSGIAAGVAPRLRLYAYMTTGGSVGRIGLRFNADVGANYSFQRISAIAGVVGKSRGTVQTELVLMPSESIAANSQALSVIDIQKPVAGEVARVQAHTSFFADLATDAIVLEIIRGEWNNTGALINRIDLRHTGAAQWDVATRVVLEGAS